MPDDSSSSCGVKKPACPLRTESRGWPSTSATMFTPKVDCIAVFLKRLLSTTLGTSPLAKARNGMIAFDRAVVPMELFSILLDRSTLELLYASETHALVAHTVSTWGPLGTWLRTKHVVDAFPEHREKVVSSVPWTPGTRLAALALGDIVLRVGRGASFASLPTLWGL